MVYSARPQGMRKSITANTLNAPQGFKFNPSPIAPPQINNIIPPVAPAPVVTVIDSIIDTPITPIEFVTPQITTSNDTVSSVTVDPFDTPIIPIEFVTPLVDIPSVSAPLEKISISLGSAAGNVMSIKENLASRFVKSVYHTLQKMVLRV